MGRGDSCHSTSPANLGSSFCASLGCRRSDREQHKVKSSFYKSYKRTSRVFSEVLVWRLPCPGQFEEPGPGVCS